MVSLRLRCVLTYLFCGLKKENVQRQIEKRKHNKKFEVDKRSKCKRSSFISNHLVLYQKLLKKFLSLDDNGKDSMNIWDKQ
jgi:hypothetical protein